MKLVFCPVPLNQWYFEVKYFAMPLDISLEKHVLSDIVLSYEPGPCETM